MISRLSPKKPQKRSLHITKKDISGYLWGLKCAIIAFSTSRALNLGFVLCSSNRFSPSKHVMSSHYQTNCDTKYEPIKK